MNTRNWFLALRQYRLENGSPSAAADFCASILADTVLSASSGRGRVVYADLARAMGCSHTTARRRVQELSTSGWLGPSTERTGPGTYVEVRIPRFHAVRITAGSRSNGDSDSPPYCALGSDLKVSPSSVQLQRSLTGSLPGGARPTKSESRMRVGRLDEELSTNHSHQEVVTGARGRLSGDPMAPGAKLPEVAKRSKIHRNDKPLERWSPWDLLSEFREQALGHIPVCRTDQISQEKFLATMKRWRSHGIPVPVILAMMEMFFADHRNLVDIGDRWPLWQRFVRYGQTHQKSAAEKAGAEQSSLKQMVNETKNGGSILVLGKDDF